MTLLPKHKFSRVATSAAITGVETRLYGIMLVGGSANSTLKLFNNGDGSGTDTISVAALAGTTVFVCLDEFGPVQFGTALYATIAGTGAVAYLWYE